MTHYVYEIKGEPRAWTSHKGYGKKSFNPHWKEKEYAQAQLSRQNDGRPLIDRAVRADFFFEMPVPKSMPKKIQKKIADGEKVWHDKRKDRTNCIKWAEDCLTGTVLKDDNIVVAGEAQKYYARQDPKTIIVIQTIEEE